MVLGGLAALIFLIPHSKRRESLLALMIFQAILWLCDMFAFKFGLMSAPVRVLPKAIDLPVVIDYYFYPTLFSIYYVNRSGKSSEWSQLLSFFIWFSALTLYDILLERYTNLLKYDVIAWYGIWIYIGSLFFISQLCCNWFFREKSLFFCRQGERN